MKNSIESFKNNFDHAEERISNLEDRTLEKILHQKSKKNKKEGRKPMEIIDTMKETFTLWEFQKENGKG